MKFVYPEFLWAMLALLIPIVIHLFHFRRYKKVIFPNVRFLQNIQRETQSVKRLRNFLVLLSRLLALTFLILAFAQPFRPMDQNSGKPNDIISIYIDNSFSMEAQGEQGPLLEEAKNKARGIIKAYPESTRFQMIDNSGRRSNRFVNRDDAIAWVDDLETGPVTQKYSDVMKIAGNALERTGSSGGTIFFLSDFQGNQEIVPATNDTTWKITALPLRAATSRNLSIDTAWVEEPVIQKDQTFQLFAEVSNRGADEVTEATIALDVDGIRKSSAGFDLAPGERTRVEMGVSLNQSGWRKGELHLEDEDLAFDNSYYLTFYLKDKIRVLSVYDEKINPYLHSLYSTDPNFELVSSAKGNIDLNELQRADLLVLDGLGDISSGVVASVKQYVDNGGAVWIIPSTDEEHSNLDNLTQSLRLPNLGAKISERYRVASLLREHPLFQKVFKKFPENPDLPLVHQHYSISASSGEPLMVLENRSPFLISQQIGKGHAYLQSAPLNEEWTTFPQHALFVPIGLRMSMLRSNDLPLASTLGRTNLFKSVVESATLQNELRLKIDELEWIPVVNPIGSTSYIDAGGTEVPSGNVDVIQGDSIIQVASFNYHRGESESGRYTDDQIKLLFENSEVSLSTASADQISHSIIDMRSGKRYWKVCVILALIFLAIEILLLRFWKTRKTSEKVANDPAVAA